MCQLIESLCLENGIIKNIQYHNMRMNKSRTELFGCSSFLKIEDSITIPRYAQTGIWKIRIHYSGSITKIEFEQYKRKTIRSLQIVFSDSIEYAYKYADRTSIAQLFEKRNNADDILIIKGGFVTDSSSANVAFLNGIEWITPATPLLPGTKRAKLLDEGIIKEDYIALKDISKFSHICLINAFLDIGDILLPTSKIYF